MNAFGLGLRFLRGFSAIGFLGDSIQAASDQKFAWEMSQGCRFNDSLSLSLQSSMLMSYTTQNTMLRAILGKRLAMQRSRLMMMQSLMAPCQALPFGPCPEYQAWPTRPVYETCLHKVRQSYCCGNSIASEGLRYAGKSFKYGQSARCADFVSTVLINSGQAPRGFKHTCWAPDLAKVGVGVRKQNLRPGDIVLFDNTYTSGKYTHTGIYIGQGKFVHRPTKHGTVRVDRLDAGYWAGKYSTGRRV